MITILWSLIMRTYLAWSLNINWMNESLPHPASSLTLNPTLAFSTLIIVNRGICSRNVKMRFEGTVAKYCVHYSLRSNWDIICNINVFQLLVFTKHIFSYSLYQYIKAIYIYIYIYIYLSKPNETVGKYLNFNVYMLQGIFNFRVSILALG